MFEYDEQAILTKIADIRSYEEEQADNKKRKVELENELEGVTDDIKELEELIKEERENLENLIDTATTYQEEIKFSRPAMAWDLYSR